MKEQFFEFDYSMDESTLKEIWQSSNTIFVVDTNVLLNLYSYQENTRNTIFESLEKIEDRLWSPHQIMLEYNKNRNEIIYQSRKDFESISNHLSNFINAHKCMSTELKTFDNNYGKKYPELRELFNNFEKESSQCSKDFIENLKQKSTEISNKIDELTKQTVSLKGKDTIREKLATFYTDEKIGQPYTNEEIEKIYEEGNQRYTDLIPPGYKDSDKNEKYYYRGTFYQSKFGDLVLYKQILKHCKENSITNVVFITEDNKEDWKEKIPHEKQSYYGIRREIRAEAFQEAKIENFITLNIKEFIEHSNQNKLEESLVHDLDAVHQLYLNYGEEAKAIKSKEENLLEDFNNQKDYILSAINSYEQMSEISSKEIEKIDEAIYSIEGRYITNPDISGELHIESSRNLEELWYRRNVLKQQQEDIKNKQYEMKRKLENLYLIKDSLIRENARNKLYANEVYNQNSKEDGNTNHNVNKYFNSRIEEVFNEMPLEEKEKLINLILNSLEINESRLINSPSINKNFKDKFSYIWGKDK